MNERIKEIEPHFTNRFTRPRRAQDLTEYALLVALIALVIVVAVVFFGEGLSEFWSNLSEEVGSFLE